jgi:hypothetical protein
MSITRLDEQTILSIIENKERETLYMDYKSAQALEEIPKKDRKLEISKDISAFANSAGGEIIYGIKEKKHIPIEVDGTHDLLEKANWLNRVINGNIIPPIEGIDIYPVEITSRDSFVLVVRVPMSHTAHQAKNKIYYHRYDEENLAMDDYQIRQTMNRGIEPQLILKSYTSDPVSLPIIPDHKQVVLDLYVTNEGRNTAKSCWFNIYLPRKLNPEQYGSWILIKSPGLRHYQLHITFVSGQGNIIPVVHPGQDFMLSKSSDRRRLKIKILDSYVDFDEEYYGKYEFWAENMTPKRGRIKFVIKDRTFYYSIE